VSITHTRVLRAALGQQVLDERRYVRGTTGRRRPGPPSGGVGVLQAHSSRRPWRAGPMHAYGRKAPPPAAWIAGWQARTATKAPPAHHTHRLMDLAVGDGVAACQERRPRLARALAQRLAPECVNCTDRTAARQAGGRWRPLPCAVALPLLHPSPATSPLPSHQPLLAGALAASQPLFPLTTRS
jgi:hypothetical protein